MEITPFSELPRYDPVATTKPEASDELGKDAFLKLLTVQLQNQDPSSPVENEAFVAQLAQFSSLEQLVGMQSTLEDVYLGIAAMNNSSMSSLLGKDVVAVGDGFSMGDSGGATLHFEAAGPYSNATINILDPSGSVVHSESIGSGEMGEHTFEWDGKGITGGYSGAGVYRFTISVDGEDAPDIRTLTVGTIDEMDYSTGSPLPSVGGVSVSLDNILRLASQDTF